MSAAGAGAAAAAAQAIRVSGTIVRVEPMEFARILGMTDDPLIVSAPGGFLVGGYHYLTSFKGLAFVTRSREPMHLPPDATVVAAQRIWVP